MTDPTQLLPQPVLGFLNIFVRVTHLLNHYLGYGIGYGVFVVVALTVLLTPGIAVWASLVRGGMSSDDAARATWLLGTPMFVVGLLLCGYVYFHGGNVSHPV